MSTTTATIATITTRGPDLVVTTSSELLADHYWQDRASLLKLSGLQRLQLVIELDDAAEPIRLFWAPKALPVSPIVPPTFRPQ